MMENVGKVAASRQEEYAQERRDSILNAALRIFAQTGFAEAQMAQVAAAADLSKAVLFSYFPSKDALLESLHERYALLPELPEMMAGLGDTPPALGLPTLIAEIWRLLRERRELADAVNRKIEGNCKPGKLFASQIGRPSYRSLACYLEGWMDRGILRRQNALAAAQSLIGMLWFF